MTAPAPGAAEPRRRLHPLTPLLRGGRLAVLAVVGISWQGYQNLGTQSWLMAVALVGLVTLLGSVVSYLVTGYHVVGRELRVYEGLISRRTRTIPLERLQAVELVQPLLARLFGLAELRLEVVGAAKTEAPLAFLTVAQATELRERLLGLSRRLSTPARTADGQPGEADASQPTPREPEQVLHVLNNRDLIVSALLRPEWWFLPLAIAAPIVFFAADASFTFVAVASTITAAVGAALAPVRAVLGDWSFTIARTSDGLRIRRGLAETRSQTVPLGRTQAVQVVWPLLWRGQKWVRVQLHVAGVTLTEQQQQRAGLLPVGTVPVAEQMVAEVMPGFQLTSVMVRPVPARARWLAPLSRRVLGYQLTDTALVTRDGVITRRLTVVPYARFQSVRVRQGVLQRLLRLATVYADPGGGAPSAAALHLDAGVARTLATELADRSRSARRS